MRALLDVPGLAGASDAVRLAVLVLASRTPSETGVVEIRTSELGRWLGLSASYVASVVLPVLRRSGVVSVDTAEGEFGQDDGLECRVLPLWAAQDVVGHPLNLSKKKYATLLRLLEAVMAPGWTHRDGRVTPAGLLGSRTGRGAATDRLALLLLVLEARESGRVRQCGGTVDTKRGRPAVTLARLLGCTASAGERVLERLEARGLVRRVRVQTASDLAHRTRLVVPAVAAAHGRTAAGVVREDRAEDRKSDSSDPDVAAGAGGTPETELDPQVSGAPVTDEAGVAEPDAAASLHTDHPGVVTAVGESAGVGGFSGEGRGGSGGRPERAGACDEPPPSAGLPRPRCTSPSVRGSALRAEQPIPSRPVLFPCLGPVLSRRVPQVAGLLDSIVPSPNGYQRERLARVVRGLLAGGEDDAMIAFRLRERLELLATGDADRPYAFRRDGLSWALTVGLPYTPGGLTTLPCSRRGCQGTVRARPADTVRCDDCELTAVERERARARREAAATPRPKTPCDRCGEPASAGLCGVCWANEETETLITQAVALAAAGCGDPDDPAMTAALAGMAEQEARSRIQDACAHLASAGGTDKVVALQARLTAQSVVHEFRATALLALGTSSPQAEAEARSACAAQLRRRHLHPSAEAARQAAQEAGEEARRRTAEYLLTQRSNAWLAVRASAAAASVPAARCAAYEAGAARARAAGAPRPARDGRAGRPAGAGHLLVRPEADALQAAADAEETARLRAQIAAEMPGLAAVTVAHHGTVYDMPPRPGTGQLVPQGCQDEGDAQRGMPV